MKLLYCINCDSIVRLKSAHRQCECGKVGGRYIDNLNAIYYGKAFVMGIDNNSFAIRLSRDIQKNILYNSSNKLDFDSSNIECFAFGKGSWCSGGQCGKTMHKVSRKQYLLTK